MVSLVDTNSLQNLQKRLASFCELVVRLHRKGYRGVVKINLADGNISKKVRIEDTVEID